MNDGDLPLTTAEVVRLRQRISDGPQEPHQLLDRQRGALLLVAALHDHVEGFTFEPLEHHVRHEGAVVGVESVDRERTHHRGQRRRQREQQLALRPELTQERFLTLSIELLGKLQTLERHRRVEALMLRAVNDGEAALGNDGFDPIRAVDDAPDDVEDVGHHDQSRYLIPSEASGTTPALCISASFGYEMTS